MKISAWRLPRLRFTVRRLMVLIAIVAVLMPVMQRAVWLYRHPIQLTSYGAGVVIQTSSRRPLYIESQCDFSYSHPIPAGLPYWFTGEVKVVDAATGVTVASHRWHQLWISGIYGQPRTNWTYNLPALRPGRYYVRGWFRGIDMLSRKAICLYNDFTHKFNVYAPGSG